MLQAKTLSPSMAAIPNVGSRQTGTGREFLDTKIPTPKELVKQLDQYVVGQTHAKKVSNFFLSSTSFFIV